MEQPSGNLVDLALVSKLYPVANYSYPRKSSACKTAPKASRSYSRCSSNTTSSRGRESLDSEGSAPGLIEDRADSEVSLDDDYQYHTHMTELWDSFWPPRSVSKPDECIMMPSKQYPALIPSPHRKKQSLGRGGREPLSWPLRDASSPPPQQQSRKAAATYSAFPKSTAPPPTRELPPVPSRTASKRQLRPWSSQKDKKPLRPPRPAENLLTPCIQQPAFVPVSFAVSDYIIQKDDDLSPISPTNCRRPTTSHYQCTRESCDEPLFNRPSTCTIYSVVSHSATHLPAPEIRPSPIRAPRHFKSIAALSPCRIEQEPISVFEDDSDDDVEEDHGKKFFSFHHRRSESDHKRRRNRSNTTPPTPTEDEPRPPLSPTKRHGHDVFGRLIGRRSR